MNKRILVIDDDRIVLKQVEMILGQAGFETVLANDAVDAVDKLSLKHFHLILSDIMMPELNGFDLVQMMKQLEFHIPVVFMSNLEDENTALRAKHLSGRELIHKSKGMVDLGKTIRSYLN